MEHYRRALTIAGSDSGGGAGIQADLKTFSALGCYGMSVLTALTAQNTVAVTDIHSVPTPFITAQIDAVLGDIGVDAVKIGMVHSAEAIAAVAERLTFHRAERVVVDPVMVATSGDRLLKDSAISALRSQLLPMAMVLTPNVPEAAVLLETDPVQSPDDMEEACRQLAELGPRVVVLKGGHLSGEHSIDMVYDRADDLVVRLQAPRIDTPNAHGTGCTLSSAIAAHLAHGEPVLDSVDLAKRYLTDAIAAGANYQLGHGHGPVHHFAGIWK